MVDYSTPRGGVPMLAEYSQIQIQNGNQHWVLSIQLSNGEIYLLDSLALNITTSLEYQLAQIYGKNRKKTFD